MSKGLPRWFRLFFVLMMIVLCFVVVTQLIAQRNYALQLDELHNDIEIANGQLALQKKQNREYLEEKVTMTAEIAELAPVAEAKKAETDALKAEKKAVKKEVTDLQTMQEGVLTQNDLIIQSVLEVISALGGSAE